MGFMTNPDTPENQLDRTAYLKTAAQAKIDAAEAAALREREAEAKAKSAEQATARSRDMATFEAQMLEETKAQTELLAEISRKLDA